MSFKDNFARGHGSAPSQDFFPSSHPLSLVETAKLHLSFAQEGLASALKFKDTAALIVEQKHTASNILKSALLQAILLLSALVFNSFHARRPTHGIVSILLHIFWLYPLCLASIYFTGLFGLRAMASPTNSRGRSVNVVQDYRGLLPTLVAESYRASVLLNYMLFAFALRYIPVVGGPLSFLYCSAANSYYVYEAQWIKSGWGLNERIQYLEQRWSYFLGFGLPITLVSYWSSDPIVNFSLFSLYFPVAVLMASFAIPVPSDPKLPTSSLKLSFLPSRTGGHGGHGNGASSFSMASAEGGEESRGRTGNPFFPIRIPILILANATNGLMMSIVPPASKKKDAAGSGGNGYGQFNVNAGVPAGGGWRGDGGSGSRSGGGGGQQYSASSTNGGGGQYSQNTIAQQQSFGNRQPYGAGATYPNPISAQDSPYSDPVIPGPPPPRRGHQATASEVNSTIPIAPPPQSGGFAPPFAGSEGGSAVASGVSAMASAAASRKRD